MNTRRYQAAVAAVVLFAGLAVQARAAQPLPADLAQAAAAYDRAQTTGDRVALNRLLADDYTLVNGAGEVETKAQFVEESSAADFKLNPFVVEHPIATVWRDGAVLAGETHLSGSSGGKPFLGHMRFADVWARRDGVWRVVFTQVGRLP